MKVITNAQGKMETVDSDDAQVNRFLQDRIVALRTELRDMLSGNIQFHVDPQTQVYVVEKPVLKWIPWNEANLDSVGNALIHCRDFEFPVTTLNYVTNAKFAHETYGTWDEFCIAAPGTVHYASFDRGMFQA